MKLGTQTKSLMNYVSSITTRGQPTPVVGMGATILLWTDRQASTIQKVTEIGGSKRWLWEIEVTEDRETLVSGSVPDESATYRYESRPDGHRLTFRFNRLQQKWIEGRINARTGLFNITHGCGLMIGKRSGYRDPSF